MKWHICMSDDYQTWCKLKRKNFEMQTIGVFIRNPNLDIWCKNCVKEFRNAQAFGTFNEHGNAVCGC